MKLPLTEMDSLHRIWESLLSTFYKWAKWDFGSLSHLLKSSQIASDVAHSQLLYSIVCWARNITRWNQLSTSFTKSSWQMPTLLLGSWLSHGAGTEQESPPSINSLPVSRAWWWMWRGSFQRGAERHREKVEGDLSPCVPRLCPFQPKDVSTILGICHRGQLCARRHWAWSLEHSGGPGTVIAAAAHSGPARGGGAQQFPP